MNYNRNKAAALLTIFAFAPLCSASFFTAGNVIVSVEGNGVIGGTGSYTDNQAAPLTLFQYSTSGTSGATYVNSLVLPQTSSGANSAVSGEYGSSSEGTLQLSGDGRYLTIMGYGINANTFNNNPAIYSSIAGNTALAQSGSLTGQTAYTPVSRVAALIDANGNVDSSTALYNVFNTNNPRSAYTLDGTSIYVSGQGAGGDTTAGVYYTQRGNSSATAISGNDAGSGTSQDTRTVQIYNGTLYVSVDSKSGANNRDYIGTLGTKGTPPTSLANGGNGPAMLSGYGNAGGTGKLTVTAATANGVNTVGTMVNLSPENYFFANASTLYVTDSGSPKNTSTAVSPATTSLGDGGLQKWVNSKADGTGTWSLEYTLYNGLNLVANTQSDAPGQMSYTTGLYGLAGEVNGNQVQLFATNYNIGDLDPTYLYGITDSLSATSAASGEAFTQLAAAPADSNFKGVSLAPTSTPEPTTFVFAGLGIAVVMVRARRW